MKDAACTIKFTINEIVKEKKNVLTDIYNIKECNNVNYNIF
jgi:hypothetical protein